MNEGRPEQATVPSNSDQPHMAAMKGQGAVASMGLQSLQPGTEELLAAIVANSDDAIISQSAEGIITSFNPGAERMYGYSAEEVIGRHVSLLLPPDRANEFASIITRLRRGERIDHFDTVRMRKDGSLLDVSVTISPIRDASGHLIGASKVARDITYRKQVERSLHEQSRILETLNRTGQGLLSEFDVQKRMQVIADAAREVTGAHFAVFIYTAIDEKGDASTVVANAGISHEQLSAFSGFESEGLLEACFAGKRVTRSDDVANDERYRELFSSAVGDLGLRSYLAAPVVSRSGALQGGLFVGHSRAGMFNANHEHLVAGMAAQASIAVDNAQLFRQTIAHQRELQLVTDAMPALVAYIDYELRYQFNNKTYEEWFHRSRDELRGKHVREVLGERAYQKLRPYFEAALQGQTVSYETVAPYEGVGDRHIQATYIPHHDSGGKVAGIYVMVIDVTERMKQQQALLDSELRLRQALKAGHMGAWEYDIISGKVRWSEELELLHGLEPGTFRGTFEAFFADVHPEDRQRVLQSIETCMASRTEHHVEYRIIRPDQSIRWVEGRGQVFENAQQQPERLVGVCIDVTSQKKFEEDLRRSEEEYRASFELAAVGKAQVEPSTGQFLRVNRKLSEISGYPENEMLALTFPQIMHREDQASAFDDYQRLVRGEIAELASEFRLKRKDGELAWVSVNAAAVRDASGRPVHAIFVIQDVSDRKRAESELVMHRERLEDLITQRTKELEDSHERLRLSERMAALGTLSAGLGHDMGNLLLPLRLRMDAMEAKGVPPETREDLDAIRKCAEYLQRLANGLRLFALDPDSSDTTGNRTDLHEWWPDVHSFFKNALPRQIVLEPRLPANLPMVRLARPNLTQAIFNLVQNAGDAMKARSQGQVTIWAEEVPGANMVRMGVSDDGPGMSPDVKRRCLEPFFTTKTRAISTGLGLALVHGIVQKAGGKIEIDSELGRGTTFLITLPAVHGDLETEDDSDVLAASVRLKDDRMRAYVASVLTSLGYEVICSDRSPNQATTIWVTDEISPHMAQDYVESRPDRQVLAIGVTEAMSDLSNVMTVAEPNPRPAMLRQLLRDLATRQAEINGVNGH